MFNNDRMRPMTRHEMSKNSNNSMNENSARLANKTKDFERDRFSQGENWARSGLAMEDANLELRRNMNFVKGYDHGKRFSFIKKSNDNNE